jgi:hypothetical protein
MPYDSDRYTLQNVSATQDKGITWNLVDKKTGARVQKVEAPGSPWVAQETEHSKMLELDKEEHDLMEKGRGLMSAMDRAVYDSLVKRNPQVSPMEIFMLMQNNDRSKWQDMQVIDMSKEGASGR